MANKKITDYTEVLAAGVDDFLDISVDLGGGVYDTRKIKASNIGGASPLTTKGDLFTFDTADARLPVGTDGQALIADSAEPTGLRWGTVSADNMATADLTLTAARTHDLAGFELKFDNGQVTIEGAGSTSATTSLIVQNSVATQLLKIDDDGGFALGNNAVYGSRDNVSIGERASATATGSIAIGEDATSNSLYGVAIGRLANTGSGYNVAIGHGATNSSTGSAIGYQASTAGSSTLAVGNNATSGTQGVAVGNGATNTQYGVAIGKDATTSANAGGLAVGNSATCSTSTSMIFSARAFAAAATNSTSETAEFYLSSATSVFRFGETADGWLNSTGGFVFGANSVDGSAALQVDSTTKGFLPPRMTTTEKNAITTPATGLVVFDNTLAKLCIYTGSAWETVTSA